MARLGVGLPRVEKLHNWREPIPQGYFSKLTVNNSGSNWGVRQDHTYLRVRKIHKSIVVFAFNCKVTT